VEGVGAAVACPPQLVPPSDPCISGQPEEIQVQEVDPNHDLDDVYIGRLHREPPDQKRDKDEYGDRSKEPDQSTLGAIPSPTWASLTRSPHLSGRTMSNG